MGSAALEVEIEASEFHVGGLGDFDVAFGAVDDVDVVTEAFDEAGFVGGVDFVGCGPGESFFQQFGAKNLRRLREDHTFAGNGAGDERDVFGKAGALHFLDGIHCGNAEDGGAALAGFFDDAGNLFAGDEGANGVVDGDVLAHAMCDAVLGAAALGDIGTHFPDTDPKWKGANSLLFLEHARKLLDEKGLKIQHVDAVVITEKPKLGPHFPKMREALAKSLGVSPETIHLKAKTNEGVDAIGRGEAIAAHVVATLSSE